MKTKPSTPAPVTDTDKKRQQRPVITKEFKLAALARMKDEKQTVTALAAELGVRRTQLYKWAAALEQTGPDASFGARGRKPGQADSELVKLRRENAALKQEVDILKKFDAYLKRLKR